MNGAPMHELAVFGSLFPAPEKSAETDAHAGDEHSAASEPAPVESAEDEQATGEHATQAPKPPPAHPREQKADLFSMVQLESPYSAEELRALVDGLKSKNHEAERRLAEMTAKDELIRDRLDTIAEREKTLERIRTELDQKERELAAREQEVKSEEQKKSDAEEKSAKALGALFGEGEVEVLAPRLASYGPKEAARILVTLEPERAKELLDALPQARWREFAEAYTKLVADRKTGH
jgi:hypothetical protein